MLNCNGDFDVDANADVTCEQGNPATKAIDSGVLRAQRVLTNRYLNVSTTIW